MKIEISKRQKIIFMGLLATRIAVKSFVAVKTHTGRPFLGTNRSVGHFGSLKRGTSSGAGTTLKLGGGGANVSRGSKVTPTQN